MYTLYTLPGSCSMGIVVLLEKLGVPYTPVNRNDVENYADIVPTNQVPALKTEDGQIITEGAAVALYLLERHDSPMLPKDLGRKAEFLRWMMFDYATLHPAYAKLFAVKLRAPLKAAEKKATLQVMADGVSSLWAVLDRELARKRFITGEEPSIADYLAAVYSSWGKNFREVSVTLGDNVSRMIDEVAELPEFKAAYARENIEFRR